MEKLENMEKIEAAQAALGECLVSMMPVSWKKICYYYKKVGGSSTHRYAFIEAETKAICAYNSFWRRYENYPYERMEAEVKVSKLARALHAAYLERFGEEKIWYEMYYTLNADGTVEIEFEYEKPTSEKQIDLSTPKAIFERFFHQEYKCLKGKYPEISYYDH
ncbi:MAG: DUF600 family protein [Oscillospiraceae bacterium]|nr:DUF600 family protein [Oscillospiraceae bacterium]